ncbi:MAG: right-handed parallel beta-helix repeat-containing protein [Ruminococcus sp.]|nr:right-handed parallel beta-helix repeat-containing protein [Ruminococcus sp.]
MTNLRYDDIIYLCKYFHSSDGIKIYNAADKQFFGEDKRKDRGLVISKRFVSALSKWAAACCAAVLLASGHFLLTAHAYDYSVITGSTATGASISGYSSAVAIDVTDFGADSTGSKNSAAAIQKALDYAGSHASDKVQVKVIIPAGTYSIGSCLYVHSNTWLYLQDATLRKDFQGGCLIMNYLDNDDGGFNGAHNIIIEGGVLDGNTNGGNVKAFSTIRMGHLHDLWVKNVDFKDNFNCHMLELGGAKNVTVEGCSFHEYYGPKYKEAIQFDILNNENLFEGYAPFDDTPCDNVIIKNNDFYDLMRGIGSHSATIGEYYTNFSISGNTFSNIYDSAIIMENYRRCTIENNTMTGVGSGIDFKNMTYMEVSGYNAPVAGYNGVYDRINDFSDTIIKGNSILAVLTDECPKPFGINLYGKLVQNTAFPDHDYKVEGVLIDSNNITTAGTALQMTDATGVIVNSNVLGTVTDGSIYENNLMNVKYSTDVSVKNNSLIGSNGHSIAVVGGSANSVTSNNCMNSAACGIAADKNAQLKITGNTVQSSAHSGISVGGGSVAEVKGNTITGAEESGVKISDTAGINVINNAISGCVAAGITADEGASAFVDNNDFTNNTSAKYSGQILAMPITALTADGVYGDHVQLSWLSKGGSDGYSVKRRASDSDGEFEEVAVVNTPAYIDEMLPSKTKFDYRVDALLDIGGSYTESSSGTISVRTRSPLSDCTADIGRAYRYSGKRIEPDFNIYLDGIKLQKNVDYTVKFYNNLAAGKATAVVSGCGEFYGFREFSYTISLAKGSTISTLSEPPMTLTGKTSERYEVMTVSASPSLSSIVDKPHESSELLGAIDNARRSNDLRIYSRRLNSASDSPFYGLWF